MSNFTKWHLTHEIFRILPVFSQFLWNLTFIFSDSHEKFSLAIEKYERECNILKIILVQGFCPLKIKITQFPDGSILILLYLFDFQNAMKKFSFRCVTIVTASLFRLKNLFLLKLEGAYFYRFLLFISLTLLACKICYWRSKTVTRFLCEAINYLMNRQKKWTQIRKIFSAETRNHSTKIFFSWNMSTVKC